MSIIPPDALWLLVENQLLKLLNQLPPEWPPEPIVIEAERGPVAIVAKIGRRDHLAAAPDNGPDALHRAALVTFLNERERLGRRVTGAELWYAFKANGHRWGRSSLNNALADLVRDGKLCNPRDKRGYGLPEDDPDQWQPECKSVKRPLD